MSNIRLLQGDSLTMLRTLPSNSVHCAITSPPYWGLRDYGIARQMGSEASFEEFLAKQVELFEEVKRVLHPSGTCWVNMGDSYNSSLTRGMYGDMGDGPNGVHCAPRQTIKRLHSKNLVGQPWKLAFALQDAGWILRSDIIWHKPNPMPESVTDRPTRGHEYMFLFAKKPNYFYDIDAIREPQESIERSEFCDPDDMPQGFTWGQEQLRANRPPRWLHPSGKNKQTVWRIPTEACPEAHFATFPKKLVQPCILAGTSEKGCCPKCFAPMVPTKELSDISKHGDGRKRADAPGAEVSPSSVFRTGLIKHYAVTGWEPSCKCDAGEPIPCIVLDPFSGSGTTCLVASRLMRNSIGIELNPEYLEMSRRRISEDLPLFNNIEIVA